MSGSSAQGEKALTEPSRVTKALTGRPVEFSPTPGIADASIWVEDGGRLQLEVRPEFSVTNSLAESR